MIPVDFRALGIADQLPQKTDQQTTKVAVNSTSDEQVFIVHVDMWPRNCEVSFLSPIIRSLPLQDGQN